MPTTQVTEVVATAGSKACECPCSTKSAAQLEIDTCDCGCDCHTKTKRAIEIVEPLNLRRTAEAGSPSRPG